MDFQAGGSRGRSAELRVRLPASSEVAAAWRKRMQGELGKLVAPTYATLQVETWKPVQMSQGLMTAMSLGPDADFTFYFSEVTGAGKEYYEAKMLGGETRVVDDMSILIDREVAEYRTMRQEFRFTYGDWS